MKEDSLIKNRVAAFLILLAALLVAGGGFLAFFRDYSPLLAEKQAPILPPSRENVENWQKAVLGGQIRDAAFYAGQIVPGSSFQLPHYAYIDFFNSCGLKLNVLTGPWNPNDFKRWKDLLTLRERKVPAEEGQFLEVLRKTDVPELFDLAWLQGYDPIVVRRLDVTPNEDFYEIRKDKSVWTIYPADRNMVKKSVRELTGENAALVYLYPAALADYRYYNLLLFRQVTPFLGRMPLPPAEGLALLKQKYPDIGLVAFYPELVRPQVRVLK